MHGGSKDEDIGVLSCTYHTSGVALSTDTYSRQNYIGRVGKVYAYVKHSEGMSAWPNG